MRFVPSREVIADSFRSLRHRNFRLFWIGQLISLIGTWMQSVAQGWLMHRITNSPMMLGLLGFVQFLPVLVLALPAGVIADHMDKRKLLYITQGFFLVQAGVLAALVTFGVVKAWMVLVLAFAFGVFNAFDLPLRQSFLVEMVGKPDLPNAIALNSAAFNAARVLGPAVAGVLVASVGEAGCFWLNAISYVAVLIGLAMIQLEVHRPAMPQDTLEKLAEGVRYAWRTTALRNLLILLGLTAGIGFQYMILLPVYAKDILHGDARMYGLLVSAFGVGSLLAAIWMTRPMSRWDLRHQLFIGLATAGGGMAGFAWSRIPAVTMTMGFLSGFGLILYVASTNTLLQLTTEDRFRGRIMSLYTLMFLGTSPIGALASGWLAEHWGAPIATSFCAVVLLAGALWVSARLRVLRALEAAHPTGRDVPAPEPERVG